MSTIIPPGEKMDEDLNPNNNYAVQRENNIENDNSTEADDNQPMYWNRFYAETD